MRLCLTEGWSEASVHDDISNAITRMLASRLHLITNKTVPEASKFVQTQVFNRRPTLRPKTHLT